MPEKRVFGLLAVLLIVSPILFAQMQTVVRTDGREITGEVVKTETGYDVSTQFGMISIPLEEVKEIKKAVSLEDEFKSRFSGIDKENPDQLYSVGEWAFSKGLVKQAQGVLQRSLQIDENHLESKLLLMQVEARLQRQTTQPQAPAVEQQDEPQGEESAISEDLSQMLVSEEDVYRIRRAEARREENLRVKFRNNVIQRFMDSQRGVGDFQDRNFTRTFLTYSPARQYQYMVFDANANESIKKDILIQADPAALRAFRMRIWPLISRGCASNNCHGSLRGRGGLKLFNIPLKDNRVAYTNFAILTGYVFKDGKHLIDRGHIPQSRLLLYGLPANEAGANAHPGRVRAMFTSTSHPNYRRVNAWLEMLYGPDYPNYALEYKPPFGMKLDFTGTTGALLKTPPAEEKGEDFLPEAPDKNDTEENHEQERPPLFE